MDTPASCYQPSPRSLPTQVPSLDYPGHFEVRYVSFNGGIRWKRDWVNVSIVCAGEYVGLEEIDNGVWNVWPSQTRSLARRTHADRRYQRKAQAQNGKILSRFCLPRATRNLEGPVDMWTTSLLPTYPQPW
jgi:hypothetical protein